VQREDVPYPPAKRVFDRAGSGVLLLAASPLFAAAGVIVAIDQLRTRENRGAVFYTEPRISRGREFKVVKFRVLREDVLTRLASEGARARPSEADAASLTWAGGLLKRWYLDELPQLVNVLKGEMSLVGPRPWPPEMVATQVENGRDYRLHAMAGWTGPVQAAKGEAELSTYSDLDLDYVEACRTLGQWALVRHDLGILWTTLRTMLRGEGLSF
jgi:lipopolysaccharide/colanic/teichoic acid biosynthesis glycosyltransferase